MIQFDSCSKLYGSVIGVNDISVQLPPGAYGLLGPNGSGKTTLLNLVNGQLRPTLGTIRVFGENPWNNADVFRRLGVCPAQEVQYANVSGFEWVEYLLRLQGFDASPASQMASDSMAQVGMQDAMHRPLGSYSRGMRQRTKLAQSIAHQPDILILDEPFNGLDPIGRHDMTILLRQWIQNRSLILASHILYEVEVICPSFLLILGGRLLASGSADEVQYLLAGVPSDVIVRCNRPKMLAELLIREAGAISVRLDGDSRVVVSTPDAAALAEKLPVLAMEHELHIDEVQSPDDTLQSLFNSLIKVHRGETK
jgi:ABC-2 type transport system ATP-binding protein